MVVRMPGMQLLRSLSDSVVDRMRAVGLAGVTFGGNRDIFEACGYERRLLLKQYRARYNRGDMASRIVEAYPESTWRGTGQDAVYDDESPDVETPFERAWNDLNKRLRIWNVLYRADVLAGLGHYAVILIGAPGDMGTPMPNALKPEDVKYLVPYAQEDAPITRWVEDTGDPRFGQPEQYQLRRTSQLSWSTEFMRSPMAGLLSRPVHWSRVIHIADGFLDDDVFGKPRLERVWNRLDDLDKVVGAGSESFWQRAHQGVQFDVDKEIEFDEEEAKELNRNIREFIHTQTRAIKTRGVKMEVMGSDVADFSKNVASLVSLISATTKIPQRLLLGSERGELASTTDRDTWIERVQDRRTRLAEPFMLRALVDRFIQYGVMPRPAAKPKSATPIKPGEKGQTPAETASAEPGVKLPFKPKAQGPPVSPQPRAAAPALGVGIEPDLPVHVRADAIPFAKDVKEGEIVDEEDESAQSADYEVHWDAVLDLPQSERLDNAVKAKELGPRVITDAEIRESIGLEPMSEEDLAVADAAEQQEHDREIAKVQARGPSPFGSPDGKPGSAKPGAGGKPPFGGGPRAALALRTAIVRRCGSQWCLYSHTGKVLGTHDTPKEAYAQEAAIKASEARAAADGEHSGLFIYVKVDEETARAIALKGEGAEDPSEMHVTVAYCDGDFDAAKDVIRAVAEASPMLYGQTAGIGTFPPSVQSDGKTVLWLRPDVKGLGELHTRTLDALSALGIRQRTEREYQPHITLAYVSPDDEYELPIVEPKPLYFWQLCIAKGDQYAEFPLQGSAVPTAERAARRRYDPQQPRAKKGQDNGGQWVDTSGGAKARDDEDLPDKVRRERHERRVQDELLKNVDRLDDYERSQLFDSISKAKHPEDFERDSEIGLALGGFDPKFDPFTQQPDLPKFDLEGSLRKIAEQSRKDADEKARREEAAAKKKEGSGGKPKIPESQRLGAKIAETVNERSVTGIPGVVERSFASSPGNAESEQRAAERFNDTVSSLLEFYSADGWAFAGQSGVRGADPTFTYTFTKDNRTVTVTGSTRTNKQGQPSGYTLKVEQARGNVGQRDQAPTE